MENLVPLTYGLSYDTLNREWTVIEACQYDENGLLLVEP